MEPQISFAAQDIQTWIPTKIVPSARRTRWAVGLHHWLLGAGIVLGMGSTSTGSLIAASPGVDGFSRQGVVFVQQWPGFRRGPASSVHVADGYAYVASGDRGFHTVDVRDPQHPVRVASTDLPEFTARKVWTAGSLAYVQTPGYLDVFDLSVPADPYRVASWYQSSSWDFDVIDGQVFRLQQGTHSILETFSLADPTQPLRLAWAHLPMTFGLCGVGERVYTVVADSARAPIRLAVLEHRSGKELTWRGDAPLAGVGIAPNGGYSVTHLAAETNRVYLATERRATLFPETPASQRIEAFDVRDATAAIHLGGFECGKVSNFQVSHRTGYLAGFGDGLRITDLANPAESKEVASLAARDSTLDVRVEGNLAYVAEADAGLRIVDVSHPNEPRPLGEVDLGGVANEVVVHGDWVYVADGGAGLRILDLSRPAADAQVHHSHLGGRVIGLGRSGNILTAATSAATVPGSATPTYDVLKIADVTQAFTPAWRGEFAVAPAIRGHRTLGDRVYIAADTAGLIIVDISRPDQPKELGRFDTFGTALDVEVVGGKAYVADGAQGLQIYDLTNPQRPRRLGGFPTADAARRVQVSGSTAFVLSSAGRPEGVIELVDIATPEHPRKIGTIYSSSRTDDRFVVAGDLVITSGADAVHLFNIAQPSSPSYIESIRWPDGKTAGSVSFNGRRLTVAAGAEGVAVFNLTARRDSHLQIEAPREMVLGDGSAPIAARSQSKVTATLRVLDGPGRMVDGRLEAIGPGTITLLAEQAGTDDFFGATVYATVEVGVRLKIGSTNQGAEVRWPISASTLRLETSPSLGQAEYWKAVDAPRELGSAEVRVQLTHEQATGFFRLVP